METRNFSSDRLGRNLELSARIRIEMNQSNIRNPHERLAYDTKIWVRIDHIFKSDDELDFAFEKKKVMELIAL